MRFPIYLAKTYWKLTSVTNFLIVIYFLTEESELYMLVSEKMMKNSHLSPIRLLLMVMYSEYETSLIEIRNHVKLTVWKNIMMNK